MNFGGIDLSALLGQGQQGGTLQSAGTPPINPNMAPPANFWEGNKFKIGAPGMQARPTSDPTHPANPAAPAQPTPQPANFTPQAQPQVDPRQAYLDSRPDVLQHYQQNNLASSPHLLRGDGRGTDTDGDGQISPLEFAAYHQVAHPSTPKQPQNPFLNAQQLGGGGASNPFLRGMSL